MLILRFQNFMGAVDGIISIKTCLKRAFGFSGILDLASLFIEDILHEVQKWSGSILSSKSSQTLAVSPAINDLFSVEVNCVPASAEILY